MSAARASCVVRPPPFGKGGPRGICFDAQENPPCPPLSKGGCRNALISKEARRTRSSERCFSSFFSFLRDLRVLRGEMFFPNLASLRALREIFPSLVAAVPRWVL